jgi:hypothetical protein
MINRLPVNKEFPGPMVDCWYIQGPVLDYRCAGSVSPKPIKMRIGYLWAQAAKGAFISIITHDPASQKLSN